MADELILTVMMERRAKLEKRRILKSLRDNSDPFSLDEMTFRRHSRFPRSLCLGLIQELEIFDMQKSKMPFVVRFLSALYFYAHGSYQKCIGSSYLTPMSQPSVSRCLEYITTLIVTHKQNEIKFPQTEEEIIETKTGFYREFGIKATIGAIDCTHIAIIAPPSDDNTPASLYMNRKSYYNINIEAICDHRLLFTSVNARFPGSCHDSCIWTTSPIRIHLMRGYSAQRWEWLLGDSGYPLEPWLMTPISEPRNPKEVTFNKLHAKSRNPIERAFGALKSRFRCLLKHRTLNYSHEKAGQILYACAILHNILMKNNVPVDDFYPDIVNLILPTNDSPNVGYLREAQRIRDSYVDSLL